MLTGITGHPQPAVLLNLWIVDSTHPLPDGKRTTSGTFNALQITQCLDIVGQHTADGDGGLFHLLFHQVTGLRTGQIVTQGLQINGKQRAQQRVVGVDTFLFLTI